MSTEKMYCSESQKSLSQQLLLEFSLFTFCFCTSVFRLLLYAVKQTTSKPVFL